MAASTVATFPTRQEAELVKARLAAAGISASVASDDAGGLYPNLSSSGVRVLVDESDLAEASQILAESPSED